jgi:ribosomal protein S27E
MSTQFTQVRCFCCGQWGIIYGWDRRTRVYCDSCVEDSTGTHRSGPGRGQCAGCKMFPHAQHWHDPRPTTALHICVR